MEKQKLKTFELVNPSDEITFQGDNIQVAGVAIMLLGNGAFALEDEDGNIAVPLMFLGGVDAWLKEQKITDLGAFIAEHAEPIAAFLETVAYCSIKERNMFDKAISLMDKTKAAEFREWFNDKNRSSMNNIGGAAIKLAAQVRKKNPKEKLVSSPPIIMVGH